MKLSEAILLGSTVLTPSSGTYFVYSERRGCALGMALVATKPPAWMEAPHMGVEPTLKYAWPWLWNAVVGPLPCSCDYMCTPTSIRGLIIHLFDIHVMAYGADRWTLDRLVEWVRTQEAYYSPEPPMNVVPEEGVALVNA